jgi:hypothetical protein
MKARRPHEGGATRTAAERFRFDGNTGEGRKGAVTEVDFCGCGCPFVSPRRSGPRYCLPNRHLEPPRHLLVRGSSGRPWWREVGP